MNRRLLIATVGILAIVVVTAAVGLPLLFQFQKNNNTTSTYYYTAELSTNATLTDATFYLPIPVGPDGAPLIEDIQVSSSDGPAVEWSPRIIETERGPMLAIDAEEIVGEERYYLVNENGSLARPEPITRDEAPVDMSGLRLEPALTRYEIGAQVTVEPFGNGIENGLIETRYPRGNSSLLSATYAYRPDACEPVWGGAEETCTAFQSDLYATYETKDTAIVQAGPVELWGINEWGWFFANSFNEYTQRVQQVRFNGSHAGWESARGELQAGRGSYGSS